MADNYQTEAVVTPSAIFASDEIIGGPTGDAQFPFVKTAFGPLNTATVTEDLMGKRFPVKPSGLESASVVSGQVSVTSVVAALPAVTARRFKLKALTTNDNAAIYIGPAGVTTGTGYALFPGDEMIIEQTSLANVFAIVASASQTLCYFGEV